MKRTIAVLTLMALIAALSFASLNHHTLAQGAQDPVIPLEGLDPVLLTQGKEVLGKPAITTTRGRFKYVFASEENKAQFEKDPERYEIQLGGACARMGPPVGGNADLYSVHNGRIYIFGSGDCQKRFEAAPEKYLEPVAPEFAPSPDAAKKGQALIEKAVAAMGGAAKLDGLVSWQETGQAVTQTQQGTGEYKISFTRAFPDRFRREQVRSFGTNIEVLTPDAGFAHFRNNTQSGTRPMPALYRADLEKQIKRNVLDALRARKRSDFRVAATGAGKVGESSVEQVDVMFDNVRLRLGIDPASGRVLSLAYKGRQSGSGEIGEIALLFSDFRAVDGLTLPFKTTGTFNGLHDPQQTYTVEAITLNGKLDPAAFEKPGK